MMIDKMNFNKFIFCNQSDRSNQMWWFDIIYKHHNFHITKGILKYEPLKISLNYISKNGSGYGTGHQLPRSNILESDLEEKKLIDYFDIKIATSDIIFQKANSNIKDTLYSYQNVKKATEVKNRCNLHYFGYDYSNEIITMENWIESKFDLTTFMDKQNGNWVEEEYMEEFRDCLPPALLKSNCLMAGEPYDTIEKIIKGEKISIDRYLTFTKFNNRWFYHGPQTIEETKQHLVCLNYLR
jgi:hypothetical protein